MIATEDQSFQITKKGKLLMDLSRQDSRIQHPVTFWRILNDPISGWLFEQLFRFTYAEKVNESDLNLSVVKDNSCLTELFYWQEYEKVAVLRAGITAENVYNYIVEHL